MIPQVTETIKANPKVQQAVMSAVAKLSDNKAITLEIIDQIINMFEFALKNPNSYQQLRQAAIQSGKLKNDDLPGKFDPALLSVAIAALYILKQRKSGVKNAFAKGGLAQAGRHGDSKLAHINPFEASILRAYGGSGSINPKTGLREYWGLGDLWESVKEVAKVVAPIAVTYFTGGTGGLASTLGSWLGASEAVAPALGGALLGGATSALTGGNAAQGALSGGLSGGLGNILGGAANNAFGLNLGEVGKSTLGAGLAGAFGGVASGRGALQGAAQGVIGQQLGNAVAGMAPAGQGALATGMRTAGNTFGNLMQSGASAENAAAGSVLAGLASGAMRPSQIAAARESDSTMQNTGSTSTGATPATGAAQTTATPGKSDTSWLSKAASALPLLALAGGAEQPPPGVQQAVSTLSPQQQEYFNRPSVKFDWQAMQNDANQSGASLAQYMAQNWHKIAGGQYNKTAPEKYAAGGLSIARLATGGGSGRADTIDARLSDGEYVIDAETVALLGDGSVKEGARKLDAMRKQIRAQKGKALARGKISPNARNAVDYLKV